MGGFSDMADENEQNTCKKNGLSAIWLKAQRPMKVLGTVIGIYIAFFWTTGVIDKNKEIRGFSVDVEAEFLADAVAITMENTILYHSYIIVGQFSLLTISLYNKYKCETKFHRDELLFIIIFIVISMVFINTLNSLYIEFTHQILINSFDEKPISYLLYKINDQLIVLGFPCLYVAFSSLMEGKKWVQDKVILKTEQEDTRTYNETTCFIPRPNCRSYYRYFRRHKARRMQKPS